jgi:hypothetical protein
MTGSDVGFIVIVTLYAVIGLLAAGGSTVLSQKLFSGKAEQTFYGAFLIPIAGFYLAFAAYFEDVPPGAPSLRRWLRSLCSAFSARDTSLSWCWATPCTGSGTFCMS